MKWLSERPPVQPQGDGFYYQDGQRLCEDCWAPIPKYIDFPQGLVSPESDGDRGGNGAKTRPMMAADGKMGVEHLRKAVCLPCYDAAFRRVYPGVPVPELRNEVR